MATKVTYHFVGGSSITLEVEGDDDTAAKDVWGHLHKPELFEVEADGTRVVIRSANVTHVEVGGQKHRTTGFGAT